MGLDWVYYRNDGEEMAYKVLWCRISQITQYNLILSGICGVRIIRAASAVAFVEDVATKTFLVSCYNTNDLIFVFHHAASMFCVALNVLVEYVPTFCCHVFM